MIVKCKYCYGTGMYGSNKCPMCEGEGTIAGPYEECPECKGKGHLDEGWGGGSVQCGKCGGFGYIEKD